MRYHELLTASLFQLVARAIAFSGMPPQPSVSTLIKKHATDLLFLKEKARSAIGSNIPLEDIFYLRYCVAFDGSNKKKGDINDAAIALVENLKWRQTEGSSLCEKANAAVKEALSSENKTWNNAPVREAAPHAAIVNKYITSSQIVTTTSRHGDLVYCIRAGKIDDKALMSEISADQMTQFFLYCKEVNAIVADMRSLSSNRLVTVITANDLNGVSLFGDSSFRKALSASSTKANDLYPELSGPTLLLNLPPLLGALAKLFTPLFPAEVRQRLKFEQGPLRSIHDLTDVLNGDSREVFLNELEKLVYI